MLALTSEVQFLKGVGEARARILEAKGIVTIEDLLYYVPRRYEDRRHPKEIAGLVAGETATVVAPIFRTSLHQPRSKFGKGLSIFEVILADGFRRLRCKWFNSPYLERAFQSGQILAVHGRVEKDSYSKDLAVMHPDFEILDEEDLGGSLSVGRIVPIYETAGYGRLNSRFFRKAIFTALEQLETLEDPLPATVRESLSLPGRRDALLHTHFPPETEEPAALEAMRSPAQFRLIFEELFFLEIGLDLDRKSTRLNSSHSRASRMPSSA